MKVKILEGGFPLFRKHATDAGHDVRLPVDIYLFPGEKMTVGLGIAIACKPGHAAFLVNRSSLADKNCVLSNFGVIDQEYRGEVKAILFNHSNEIQSFMRGDRVAQLLEVPVVQDDVEYSDDLEATERGEGGLGSTGK